MSVFLTRSGQAFNRLSERPFNSEQKYMAVSGTHNDSSPSTLSVNGHVGPQEIYYIKGSIDSIIDKCKFYYVNDESTPALDANTKNVVLSRAHATAGRGLRVIALAFGYGGVDPPSLPVSLATSRPVSRGASASSRSSSPAADGRTGTGAAVVEKRNLVFVGFQAMLDPPRKGVADSIGLLQAGGVQVVMITGDAEGTAMAIARELGLRVGRGGRGSLHGGGGEYCLTGQMIDQMSKAQLRERVGTVSVFARTTPRHKMAIVDAFQSRGAVVAMTGDGGSFFYHSTDGN